MEQVDVHQNPQILQNNECDQYDQYEDSLESSESRDYDQYEDSGEYDPDPALFYTEEQKRLDRIYKSLHIRVFNSLPQILGTIPSTEENRKKDGDCYWDEKLKKFFLHDETTNEYVIVPYLPCSYCGTGLSENFKHLVFGGLYCGCQDYKD
jgi:hypothetical protein